MGLSVVFPGQGSQYIGMGENLVREYQLANQIFEEANDILKINLQDYCFGIHTDRLIDTQYTQLSIYVVSYAVYSILREQFGINPSIVAGHSLGELTALTAANVFTFENGVEIVRKRGELMQQASVGDYKMAALLGDEFLDLQTLCDEVSNDHHILEISNYNSKHQQVISGHTAAVEKVVNRMEKRGYKTIYLNVNSPFHTSIMRKSAESFRTYLDRFSFNRPSIDVLSNVTGEVHDYTVLPQMLASQMVQPVNWVKCLDYMNGQAIYHVIEVGPGTSLSKTLTSHLTKAELYQIGELQEYDRINQRLRIFKPLYRLVQGFLSIAAMTEHRGDQSQETLEKITQEYQYLEKLLYSMREGTLPTNREIDHAIQRLQIILEIKKIPDTEWGMRMGEINRIIARDKRLQEHVLSLL